MAGRGPAPKPHAHRRLSGKVPDPTPTTVIADPSPLEAPMGPDLPEGIDWPEQTRHWWDSWRRHPLAKTWEWWDWDFMLDTARLHKVLWTLEDEKLAARSGIAAEVRLRVAKYGATPEDRLRLRMTVQAPAEAEEARSDATAPLTRPAVADERRARLLKVAGGAGA